MKLFWKNFQHHSYGAPAVGIFPFLPSFLQDTKCAYYWLVNCGFMLKWVEPTEDLCLTGSKNENTHILVKNLRAIILL